MFIRFVLLRRIKTAIKCVFFKYIEYCEGIHIPLQQPSRIAYSVYINALSRCGISNESNDTQKKYKIWKVKSPKSYVMAQPQTENITPSQAIFTVTYRKSKVRLSLGSLGLHKYKWLCDEQNLKTHSRLSHIWSHVQYRND